MWVKKLGVTLLLLVLTTAPTYAAIETYYGFQMGGTASTLWGLHNIDAGDKAKKDITLELILDILRFSPHGGAFLEMPLSPYWSFSVEGNYVPLGVSSKEITVEASYLNAPCYLTYYPFETINGFSTHLGMAWNYHLLMGNKLQIVLQAESSPDKIYPIDCAVIAGSQYYWDNQVFVKLRYSHGLLNIFNGIKIPELDQIKLTNRYMQVSVGCDLGQWMIALPKV